MSSKLLCLGAIITTIITAHSIGLAVILVIMSVSTFKIVIILYLRYKEITTF
jgi:hypothetical protein